MSHLSSRLRPLALSLVAAAGPVLIAQQSTGSFSGRVTSKETGAPMAGVSVLVEQKGTRLLRRVATDQDGYYRIPALPVGEYKLVFSHKDQSHSVTRTVNLGMETAVSFKFPKEASATVVVEASLAAADTINTTSAEVGVNITSSILSNLPVMDRNVNSAAVLAPGVQIIQGSQVDPTKKTSTYIVSGEGQGRGTNFNVDGADNNSTDVGGYVLPIPFDAIDQFQVVTNQYKAEFGRSNAGFLNVVTKSGSNTFAGSLTSQFQNDSLRARRTDEGDKKKDSQTILGAVFSGPILKDKLFFMMAYEGTKSSGPSAAFDPRAIATYPTLGSIENKIDKTSLYTKVDWNINTNLLASFKYAYYKDKSADQGFPHTDAVSGYVNPSMLGTSENKTTAYGGKLTATTEAFVLESTFSFFDYKNTIRPSSDGPGLGSDAQVRLVSTTNNPVGGNDVYRTGHDPNATQGTGIKRLQWKNEVNHLMSAHSLKAGLDFQRTEYVDTFYFWKEPTVYAFSAAGVPFGSEWGNTVQANQNIIAINLRAPIAQPGTTYNQFGIYAQDDWTISPKWNLYLGARLDWDTQLDYLKRYDGMYAQIHAASPGLVGMGNEAPRDKKYFSPRLQLLFKPFEDDSLVFKLGLGRFVANTIDNVVGFSRALMAPVNGLTGSAIRNNAARVYQGLSASAGHPANFSAGTVITSVNGHDLILPADLTPYNYAINKNGLRDLFAMTARGYLTPASFATGGKQLLSTDFRYPQTDTMNLGLTYKLSNHANLDLTGVYSKTRYATVQLVTDGSSPQATSTGPDGDDMGDNIFLSNQTSSTKQIQVKYTYTTERFNLLVTFVAKENKSSFGGNGGAFDQQAGADFYGGGAQYAYVTNPERRAHGSENLSGSFTMGYRFAFGTQASILGQWHSGKAYDTFLGYNAELGPKSPTDASHPNTLLGFQEGRWNLDLGLRVSHTFKFANTYTLEPYIQVSNLLNNYDYGSNYNATLAPSGIYDNTYGQRGLRFQINNPRMVAFGARFAF